MKRFRLFLVVPLALLASLSLVQTDWDSDAAELILRAQAGIHFDTTLYEQILEELSLARSVADTLEGIHVLNR